MTATIKQLTTQQEWIEAYAVLVQLRTELTIEKYLLLLKEMMQDGYMLFALFENKQMVAVAGLSWRVNFYSERHIFVYDLVTHEAYRSRGYGEKLLHYIHQWGKEKGAHYIALESGVLRKNAHRFYEDRLGYEKWCYSFRKAL
ncbi:MULTISPECIES: GNAT family N-acetyltransferase [unclassified Lysinibacillus]|uniref:GNAT family N-acetyltransferase n=1 Tax=unclassified Lysinibacillus TaxID=2636778 RepID=UPI002554CCFB|nr:MULTISPECIES: GNAT family N-acetyltransferase [unclassified Lysinibacillus]MDM5247832.1 GNAT family N-acetyltransferase [Lysinibacillus sp. G4S2]